MLVIKYNAYILLLVFVSIFASCKNDNQIAINAETINKTSQVSYGDDVNFMKSYIDIVELKSSSDQSRVAVSAQLQGRVMTSTSNGIQGKSYGWINRDLFEKEDQQEHINVFGGEERFWLGPEGGQYSIFFKNGDDFNLDNWFTPRLIDLEHFNIEKNSAGSVTFVKEASITNYAAFKFDLGIRRTVEIIPSSDLSNKLGVDINPDLTSVAYETTNALTNRGNTAWQKKTGLLSIWLLGMYNASPNTSVIIPFKTGSIDELGRIVTDDYFGKVPADRLSVGDSVLHFSGDANYRSKIGLSPQRAKDVLGSYDAVNKVLTIVKYSKPDDQLDYVNSLWEIQDEPYRGDVINSYNDGPPSPGEEQLGNFYELETSSPALGLKPGESATHSQLTCHFEGDTKLLDELSIKLLGTSIEEMN